MRYSWLIAGLLAVCASTSTAAHASCVGPSQVELLWSYPSEGDNDVPTNARLQLVLTAKLYGTDWDATLNGEPIARSPDGAFVVGPLAADTDYTFQLEGHQPRVSIATKVVELHFRTGSASADAVHAPVVVGPSAEESDDAGMCARVDARYYCRDTPPSDVREIELDEANAVAWIDDAGNIWPRGCYPRIDLLLAEDRCFNLHAVSADGQTSEPTAFCAQATDESVETQSVETITETNGSCAVAAVGGDTRRVPASLLLLCFALRRWRRWTRAASELAESAASMSFTRTGPIAMVELEMEGRGAGAAVRRRRAEHCASSIGLGYLCSMRASHWRKLRRASDRRGEHVCQQKQAYSKHSQLEARVRGRAAGSLFARRARHVRDLPRCDAHPRAA